MIFTTTVEEEYETASQKSRSDADDLDIIHPPLFLTPVVKGDRVAMKEMVQEVRRTRLTLQEKQMLSLNWAESKSRIASNYDGAVHCAVYVADEKEFVRAYHLIGVLFVLFASATVFMLAHPLLSGTAYPY